MLCIRDDREEQYRSLVRDLSGATQTICSLILNSSTKTKELVIDFGKSRPRPRLFKIKGVEVEAADSCKYLWLWLDNKLVSK